MKIYLVEEHYDNGELYEDNIYSISVVAVATEKERAEKWVADFSPDAEWVEGNPFSDSLWMESEKPLRVFYVPARNKYCEAQLMYFTIKEMEAI